MISGNSRRKILVVRNLHTVMVHGITQLAFFSNRWLILSGLVRIINSRCDQMLVSIHHCLPCDKADHDDPGVNNMLLTVFQNRVLLIYLIFYKNSQIMGQTVIQS
jgi:hypothetical protein